MMQGVSFVSGWISKLILLLILFVNAISHGFHSVSVLAFVFALALMVTELAAMRVNKLQCQVGYSVVKQVNLCDRPEKFQKPHCQRHSLSGCRLRHWFFFVLCLEFCTQATAKFNPYHAIRIGEATQPGPSMHRNCTIAITNPTSIVSKPAIYHQLISQFDLDVVAASETAATRPAQKLFSHNMRQANMRSQWSCPVPEKTVRSDGQPSLRGQATGVALFARCPTRILQGTIPDVDLASSRILHCLVDFEGFEMQIVVLYGYAAAGSVAANRSLMQLAIRAVRALPLPFIILGDFNANPWKLGMNDELQSLQATDLTAMYIDLYNKPMPPTCRHVTNPDNAVISPALQPFVRSIQVLPDPYFDCHQVVLFTLDLITAQHSRFRMPMPSPWNDLPIDYAHVELGYDKAIQNLGTPYSIETWGQTVEYAVDHAYRATQCDTQHIQWDATQPLPQKYRGRCQPRVPKPQTKLLLTKPGRPGDFHPGEVCRAKTRDMIKQVRRIQGLLSRLKKFQHDAMSPDQYRVMHEEWQAILRSHCMQVDFVTWCQHTPELGPPTYALPTIEFLHTMLQLVKHHATDSQAFDRKYLESMRTYHQYLDAKWAGHSRSCTRMKEGFVAPLEKIARTHQQDALVVPNDDNSWQVWCDQATQFQATQLLQVADIWCTIIDKDDHSLQVRPVERNQCLPDEALVTQQQETLDPNQIFDQLRSFWAPFWEQDNNDPQLDVQFQTFLDQLPSHLPPIAFDLHSPDLWIDAVRSLKTSASRGVDAISAWELKRMPVKALVAVKDILLGYQDGFPEWFMVAFTAPIPKTTDVPRIDQLRPITILAQLYRLWARVTCRQILCHLSRYMPVELTGLLAGRGPLDASMRQQFFIESNHDTHRPIAGLSLDLIKCYNTVHRRRVRDLMHACALPDVLVDQWFSSLQSLQRIWTFQGSCSLPYATCNGIPEGDSWSVVAMVLLDYLWIIAVKIQTPDAFLAAYADNISWAAEHEAAHHQVALVTVDFVRSVGMAVDWMKTWIWGISQSALQQLIRPMRQLMPAVALRATRNAMELGTQMTYAGPPALGKYKTRLVKATQRLQRLRAMKVPLRSKAALILGGVFPTAFYGIAMIPLGIAHIDTLRKLCADALLDVSHSRNSALSVIATPNMLDPLEYIVVTVIRTVRRFLLQSSSEEVTRFFDLAARADALPHHCKGPASVLRFWLQKFGWQIDRQGKVGVHVAFKLCLRSTSPATWLKWIRRAWQEELMNNYCNRANLRFLHFDFAATRRLLASFPAKQQPALIQELSGAFQVETQKAHWAPDSDGTCHHCGAVDSREHRLFDCPATSDIREPFLTTLRKFQTEGVHIHEMPALPIHDDAIMLDAIHQCHPEADVTPAVLGRMLQLIDLGCTPCVYTDGSLQFSNDPTSRFAAYALVWDTCENDERRIHVAQTWQKFGIVPENFVTFACARTTGEQTAHRSELFALVRVVEILPQAVVYSDSASALAVATKCAQARSLQVLASLQDFDLVERLWHALRQGTYAFHKVKSHVKPCKRQPAMTCFHCWGNQKADDAAVTACWNLCPQIVQQAVALHKQTQLDKSMLRQVFDLHLQLHAARAKLDQARKQSNVRSTSAADSPPTPLQTLQQWTVANPWICQPNHVQQLHASPWGTAMTQILVQWMRALVWPQDQTVGSDEPGVTWHELCISFVLHSKHLVPVRRTFPDGSERLVPLNSMQDVELYKVTLGDMSRNFSIWVNQTVKLLGYDVWPSVSHGLVRSLYRLGSSIFHQGLRLRPSFPCQSDAVQIMYTYVRSHADFEYMPVLDVSPLPPTTAAALNRDWYGAARQMYAAGRLVKKLQRENTGRLSFTATPPS